MFVIKHQVLNNFHVFSKMAVRYCRALSFLYSCLSFIPASLLSQLCCVMQLRWTCNYWHHVSICFCRMSGPWGNCCTTSPGPTWENWCLWWVRFTFYTFLQHIAQRHGSSVFTHSLQRWRNPSIPWLTAMFVKASLLPRVVEIFTQGFISPRCCFILAVHVLWN